MIVRLRRSTESCRAWIAIEAGGQAGDLQHQIAGEGELGGDLRENLLEATRCSGRPSAST